MKTIKRISAILLAAVLLFSGIPMAELGIESIFATNASAITLRNADKMHGDFVYNYADTVFKDEIIIKKYMGSEKDVIVPDYIEGLPVTELAGYSFSTSSNNTYSNQDCLYIESVFLPDSVKKIGYEAFYGCENLKQIGMPEELETIGEAAFKNCTSLEEIDLSQGATWITSDAFYGTKIKDLVISSDIKFLELDENFLRGSIVENLTIETEYIYFYNYSLESETLKNVTIHGTVELFEDSVFGTSEATHLPEKINIYDDFCSEVYDELENSYGYYGEVSEENNLCWTFTKADGTRKMLTEGNYQYYLNKKGEAVINKCNKSNEEIVIPERLGNSKVTAIGWKAFRNASMESVIIPNTVTHIQSQAFAFCKNLSNISFSENLKSIGFGAFEYCTSLKSVSLPDSINSISGHAFWHCGKLKAIYAKGVTAVRTGAFSYCSSLSETEFSDHFDYIGTEAFGGCSSLVSFKYDKNTTHLGTWAFYESRIETFEFNDNLKEIPESAFEETSLKTVVLPSKLEKIGLHAFYGCDELEDLIIPDTVTVIDNAAFYFCSSLTGELIISENIKKIGRRAFSETGYTTLSYNSASLSPIAFAGSKLITVNLGENVKAIAAKMFASCKELKTVTFGNSVTKIGDEAFANCPNLENITMSDNITELGKALFEGCTKITEITIPPKVTELNVGVFTSNITTVYYNAENCTFKELAQLGAIGTYATPFHNTNVKNVIIGDTVKRIPNYFFCEADFIENVILPESVREIGKDAFMSSSIKNILLPASLIIIEERAFADTQITVDGNAFPDGMRMIGKEAFESCNNLEVIYIPDSVVDIAENAFTGCKKLSKVRMSPNVKLIPSSCFKNCSLLSDFIWDSNVKLIADYAFANCKLLSVFDFTGVELLYPNSFRNTGVTVIALGEDKNEEATNLLSVESQSFKSCTDLETLSVGGNIATIKSEAFADCSNLEVAVISNSVINIASDAFDGCNSLTIYCMENSYAHDYAVQNNIPVSTFVIAPIPNQTYTGSRIEPELDVSVSNKPLTENTDFTVKYADNINVGTAKVTVSGKGIYKVLTSIANFTIITKNIAPVTIAAVADQNYTGEAVTPSLTVTDGSNILREGTDYTVAYKNNVNTGTATATIKGIGNYSGTASVTFTILEQSFFERLISAISTFFTTIITWLQALFGIQIK